MALEIVVIEREVGIAHPSFAAGGYVVITPGAKAYRNADMVTADPKAVLAWCRAARCEVVALAEPAPSTRRYRVLFPDEAAFAAFDERFRPASKRR